MSKQDPLVEPLPSLARRAYQFTIVVLLLTVAALGIGWWLSAKQAVPETVHPVRIVMMDGCEYVLFSNGAVCHKGNCKGCQERLWRALAAQALLEVEHDDRGERAPVDGHSTGLGGAPGAETTWGPVDGRSGVRYGPQK
jgi:hypothetical protein